jgi:uncharacterized integral membrane protein
MIHDSYVDLRCFEEVTGIEGDARMRGAWRLSSFTVILLIVIMIFAAS